MSSRDIDSTSENVLHDWAQEEVEREAEQEAEADSQEELEVERAEPGDDAPEEDAHAWGTAASAGREHYNKVYSSWLAGGGIKPGVVYGASDEYGVNVAENEVHVHDFNATILHCLGFDHTRLTYRHAGRDFRLTDVHGNVVQSILA